MAQVCATSIISEYLSQEKKSAEGTYYFVFPTNTPAVEGNNAQLSTDGSMVHIENIMFGPYKIGEVKDPVDAQISVLPEGNVELSYFDVAPDSDELPSITITVANGATIALLDISEAVHLTDPTGTQVSLTMTSNKDGVITLVFDVGYTPVQGEYTLTVDYSTFNGFSTADEPLRFPAEVQTYTFTVGTDQDVQLTDMTAKIVPEPGVYETFFPEGVVNIQPTNYRPVAEAWPEQLAVLCPDLTVKYLEVKQRSNIRGAQYILPADFFNEYGEYLIRIDFKGAEGQPAGSATQGTTANLGIIEFSYTFVDPNALPDAPAVTVEGAEIVEGSVEIPYRSSVSVSFSDVENCHTFYKWNDGEEMQYSEPVAISEAGTLIYWSRTTDGKNSEPKTLSFTVEEVELTAITYQPGGCNPKPGEYEVLPTNTKLSILPKNYKPEDYANDYPSGFMTKPSGDVVELTVAQTSNVRGAQYNVPEGTFDEWGTYTLRIDFNGCKGISASTETKGTTAYMGIMELVYVFTQPIIPEISNVAVAGGEIVEGNVEIPWGKSAVLTLEATDNADIYVKVGEAQEALYTEPIEISEACTVTYYAKLGNKSSETGTLTFTIGERPEPVLPANITVTPDPSLTYKRVEGIRIKFGKEAIEGFTEFTKEDVKGTATVHEFDTDEEVYSGNVMYASYNEILVGAVIKDNGKYIVDIDLSETRCVAGEETVALPEALQRIYVVYNIDIVMAIEAIGTDSGKAEYYTLDGIRIDSPRGNGIVIKREGGKSSLIIVK